MDVDLYIHVDFTYPDFAFPIQSFRQSILQSLFLGVTLWVALYAHTARALATGPVSAAIANASIWVNMGMFRLVLVLILGKVRSTYKNTKFL